MCADGEGGVSSARIWISDLYHKRITQTVKVWAGVESLVNLIPYAHCGCDGERVGPAGFKVQSLSQVDVDDSCTLIVAEQRSISRKELGIDEGK